MKSLTLVLKVFPLTFLCSFPPLCSCPTYSCLFVHSFIQQVFTELLTPEEFYYILDIQRWRSDCHFPGETHSLGGDRYMHIQLRYNTTRVCKGHMWTYLRFFPPFLCPKPGKNSERLIHAETQKSNETQIP